MCLKSSKAHAGLLWLDDTTDTTTLQQYITFIWYVNARGGQSTAILDIRQIDAHGASVCRRLKGIHSRPDTNRTGAEGLSFHYPRPLHCLDQMLAVMLLSQHRVSSSKTVRPRAPCGARCMGHIVSTWSAVCSETPHSQFGEGARPHLCMDEWNRPTPVRRRLSLTQAARGKPIPTGLTLVPGTKARSLEAPSQYSAFHL